MLRSMTAFSRASSENSFGRLSVEIQSVNRKFLEINTFLPRELNRFEPQIKQWLGVHLSRGAVTIRIFANFTESAPTIVKPNIPLSKEIKAACEKLAYELNLPLAIDLNSLLNQPGILVFEDNWKDDALYESALKEVVEAAIADFLEMKRREGRVLHADILKRLSKIGQLLKIIEGKGTGATEKYRQKLMQRLEEVLAGSLENEERVIREVAVFAEKIDIAEEITRFQSHLTQMTDLLNSPEEMHGKTLEFLVQELNRETNTMGSKSADIEIVRAVIEIKAELERIREQIQNVE